MQNDCATQRALVKKELWMIAGTPFAPTLGERKLLAQSLRGVGGLDYLSALADDALQTAQAMEGLEKLRGCAPC